VQDLLDWLPEQLPEPGHYDARFPSQPGPIETLDSSVSGQPGRSELSGCMSVESIRAMSPCASRQPIVFSTGPCYMRVGNQSHRYCTFTTWPWAAWLTHASQDAVLQVTNQPLSYQDPPLRPPRARPARNEFCLRSSGAKLGGAICTPPARPHAAPRQPNCSKLHPTSQARPYTGDQTRPK
jgi:hypothetical protein